MRLTRCSRVFASEPLVKTSAGPWKIERTGTTKVVGFVMKHSDEVRTLASGLIEIEKQSIFDIRIVSVFSQ